MFKCKKCGREFEKLRGLQVHGYSCKKKSKRDPYKSSKKQPAKMPASNEVGGEISITIPCDLGGNPFTVAVKLGIEATEIHAG